MAGFAGLVDLLTLGCLAFGGGAEAAKRSMSNARNIELRSSLLLPAYDLGFSVSSAEIICLTCSRAPSCFLTSIGIPTTGAGKGGEMTVGAGDMSTGAVRNIELESTKCSGFAANAFLNARPSRNMCFLVTVLYENKSGCWR